MSYFIHKHDTGETMIVFENETVVRWIPCDDANSDYQAFLAWCAEGNTPEEWSAE